MLAHVHTAALRGVESFLVRVEVNLSSGLPAFTVAAALRNSGFPLLNRRITVNLAPGDVRKNVGPNFNVLSVSSRPGGINYPQAEVGVKKNKPQVCE